MNDIFSQAPEIPDPTQLDLFGCQTSDGEPPNSTISAGTPAVVELQTRDPTLNGEKKTLTESQKQRAAVLYRKSRALASKPKIEINEEE